MHARGGAARRNRPRRRHIATEILAAIERVCKGEKLFTSTNASNTAMRHFLHRMGFVESGRIDNVDADDPELVLVKHLGRK